VSRPQREASTNIRKTVKPVESTPQPPNASDQSGDPTENSANTASWPSTSPR